MYIDPALGFIKVKISVKDDFGQKTRNVVFTCLFGVKYVFFNVPIDCINIPKLIYYAYYLIFLQLT